MRSYFVKRLLLIIPTLLGISLISFLIIHLTPGDPALMKLGDADQRGGNQQLAAQIGRKRPIAVLSRPCL